MNMHKKILEWFIHGDTGISSKCMAAVACGIKPERTWTPSDPSDFNRCLMLVVCVPEVKDHFDAIANSSKQWESIIKNWDLLEKTFVDEVGLNWCKGDRATKTYALMKELRQQAEAEAKP